MSDPTNDPTDAHQPHPKPRPLSEISHLFLSSLRDRDGHGHARPARVPPGGHRKTQPADEVDDDGEVMDGGLPAHHEPMPPSDGDVDLTPDEFARTFGQPTPAAPATADPERRRRVTAVVAAHLNGDLADRARQYARQLAADGERVGTILLDAGELRLQRVEACGDADCDEVDPHDAPDERAMGEAIGELNADVDRWLLVMPDLRRPEARMLLRKADDWVLLSTCDHDGIVGGYRTLKGLAEQGPRSPLSIALLDATDARQADRVFAKLAGVCRQFLDWDVEQDVAVTGEARATVATLLWHRVMPPPLLAGPQWRAVKGLMDMPPDDAANAAHFGEPESEPAQANLPMSIEPEEAVAPAPVLRPQPTITKPIVAAAAAPVITAPRLAVVAADPADEVVELPDGASVLGVVMSRGGDLVATGVPAPMCPGASVAVGRDRGVVLVAQTGANLAGLESIAAAVKWLDDSRHLLSLALPQLRIDATAPTRVALLIDHADREATALRPLLGDGRVTIRTYRRLRWGQRTGLLLDAA